MKTLAIAQARMGSTRLPGKVLKNIAGRATLSWVTQALMAAPGVDMVMVATTTKPADDAIAVWCNGSGVPCFRGSEDDVLSRYVGAVDHAGGADVIVRATGDCPFLDPKVIGEVVQLRKMKGVDYATNTDPPTFPDGLDVEVFTRGALELTAHEATRPSDRDTVTRFMVRNRHRFSAANLVCGLPRLDRERWVLDSPEDYDFIKQVADRWFWIADRTTDPPGYLDILKILEDDPWLRDINSKFSRNERFYADISKEVSPRSYSISKVLLEQAKTLIPLGAQTFSKSHLQFPVGAAPLFVTHGDGGYCYDADGNDYVDLVGALLPNILGYRDPDVDQAVRDQLSRGVSLSLATTLEYELAQKLNFHIPSAEMVRLGKNGSDVTTAAVRLARHVTGRDCVLVGGYHGWHDWSMVHTDRRNGIPRKLEELSIKATPASWYNIESATNIFGLDVAAIIVEPEFYSAGELANLRQHTEKCGILLIFDEIITGFRCGMGGLQAVHGVTPDLSCFGKALGNGLPISALVGKRDYMKEMVNISYSGTFFGETLSIAAAIATVDKLYQKRVPDYLHTRGIQIRDGVNELLEKHGISSISLYGEPSLNRIKFTDKIIQSLFIQEMAKNGVLIISSHNLCYAHKQTELDRILSAWDVTLAAIARGAALEGGIVHGKAVREG